MAAAGRSTRQEARGRGNLPWCGVAVSTHSIPSVRHGAVPVVTLDLSLSMPFTYVGKMGNSRLKTHATRPTGRPYTLYTRHMYTVQTETQTAPHTSHARKGDTPQCETLITTVSFTRHTPHTRVPPRLRVRVSWTRARRGCRRAEGAGLRERQLPPQLPRTCDRALGEELPGELNGNNRSVATAELLNLWVRHSSSRFHS